MVAAYGAGAAGALLAGAGRPARVLSAAGAMVGAGAGLLLGLHALAGGAVWALGVPDVVSVAGGLVFRLASFLGLGAEAPALDFADLRGAAAGLSDAGRGVVFALALVGFGSK